MLVFASYTDTCLRIPPGKNKANKHVLLTGVMVINHCWRSSTWKPVSLDGNEPRGRGSAQQGGKMSATI